MENGYLKNLIKYFGKSYLKFWFPTKAIKKANDLILNNINN